MLHVMCCTCKSGLIRFAAPGKCALCAASGSCIPTPTAVEIAIQFAACYAGLIIIALQSAALTLDIFLVRMLFVFQTMQMGVDKHIIMAFKQREFNFIKVFVCVRTVVWEFV
jgi:hypothetical protein